MSATLIPGGCAHVYMLLFSTLKRMVQYMIEL